jgi:hypothetical protein
MGVKEGVEWVYTDSKTREKGKRDQSKRGTRMSEWISPEGTGGAKQGT